MSDRVKINLMFNGQSDVRRLSLSLESQLQLNNCVDPTDEMRRGKICYGGETEAIVGDTVGAGKSYIFFSPVHRSKELNLPSAR